jgi:hypothetical protein
MTKFIFSLLITCFIFSTSSAQTEFTYDPKWSVVLGLTQPLFLQGFNAEVNYYTPKMVFDYSHGVNLKMTGAVVAKAYEDQKINFKVTHTLGFGVGYRFTKRFNVRFEPKLHIYETYYDGVEQQKSNSLKNFSTTTLGVGAYYRWLPFEKKNNALKGITIAPSLRYWYKVASTLDNDKFAYLNSKTNKNEAFDAPNIGLSNTPIIVNISVGYSF